MERHTFLIDPVVGDRLKAIKARSGLSESEQVRRAITLWLETFGWPIQERGERAQDEESAQNDDSIDRPPGGVAVAYSPNHRVR
jgi:hypothetical protein